MPFDPCRNPCHLVFHIGIDFYDGRDPCRFTQPDHLLFALDIIAHATRIGNDRVGFPPLPDPTIRIAGCVMHRLGERLLNNQLGEASSMHEKFPQLCRIFAQAGIHDLFFQLEVLGHEPLRPLHETFGGCRMLCLDCRHRSGHPEDVVLCRFFTQGLGILILAIRRRAISQIHRQEPCTSAKG